MDQWAATGEKRDEERYGQFGNSQDKVSISLSMFVWTFSLLKTHIHKTKSKRYWGQQNKRDLQYSVNAWKNKGRDKNKTFFCYFNLKYVPML